MCRAEAGDAEAAAALVRLSYEVEEMQREVKSLDATVACLIQCCIKMGFRSSH